MQVPNIVVIIRSCVHHSFFSLKGSLIFAQKFTISYRFVARNMISIYHAKNPFKIFFVFGFTKCKLLNKLLMMLSRRCLTFLAHWQTPLHISIINARNKIGTCQNCCQTLHPKYNKLLVSSYLSQIFAQFVFLVTFGNKIPSFTSKNYLKDGKKINVSDFASCMENGM